MTRSVGIGGMPMYDWPEIRQANDTIWAALSDYLTGCGLPVQAEMMRPAKAMKLWTDKDLVLAQTCGWPFVKYLQDKVRPVATPHYAVGGCSGPTYSSFVLVRRNDPASSLADCAGRAAAVNSSDSWSGYVTLDRELSANGGLAKFAGNLETSGSHLNSMRAVCGGIADFCAIDAVCWGLAQRYRPELARTMKAVAVTKPAPGLPFITRAGTSDDDLEILRSGVRHIMKDPDLREARKAVFLDGFSILEAGDYAEMKSTRRKKQSAGRRQTEQILERSAVP